ncbi:hypothetical protein RA280_19635 [Cupriavidus sp. CV2]|uniref:hypothetical protein n=1 Tax=Cupriavidus ulmosensis TaxID=3065913 RepID=UPI00296AE1B3|nr:hypothetical protein [Cupriavidus sp. CV2]MDW3683915.1 hypothetical protein [Cupriavidus sp. CV2]
MRQKTVMFLVIGWPAIFASSTCGAVDADGLPTYKPVIGGDVKEIQMGRSYPAQPTAPGKQLVDDQLPYVVTKPAPGNENYRPRNSARTFLCKDKTYVAQLRAFQVSGFRAEVEKLVGVGGKCRVTDAGEVFKVIRFESFNVPAGHFEVAYVQQIIKIINKEGKSVDIPIIAHVARDEIELDK